MGAPCPARPGTGSFQDIWALVENEMGTEGLPVPVPVSCGPSR